MQLMVQSSSEDTPLRFDFLSFGCGPGDLIVSQEYTYAQTQENVHIAYTGLHMLLLPQEVGLKR